MKYKKYKLSITIKNKIKLSMYSSKSIKNPKNLEYWSSSISKISSEPSCAGSYGECRGGGGGGGGGVEVEAMH